MAYTFFKARGMNIGNSLLEPDKVDIAAAILKQGGDKIVLPVDSMVTDRLDFAGRRVGQLEEVAAESIPDGWEGIDIGRKSIALFAEMLADARTVVWNGPMGVFEIEKSAKGTIAIAKFLADLTDQGATTVIGGGDSALAIRQAGVADRVSHVSTGGGASLEFMEGKILPGVAALTSTV